MWMQYTYKLHSGTELTLASEMKRLVFTSNRDGAGVVIRSIELYDLLQTALWVLWFRLQLHHLRSSENWVVWVASRSERTKPITMYGNVYCDWFILPLLLLTLTIWLSLDNKRNVSDGVVSGVWRKWNLLILLSPIPSRL